MQCQSCLIQPQQSSVLRSRERKAYAISSARGCDRANARGREAGVAPASSNNDQVGTSGWNYPSGKGTWNGIFYPPRATCARTRQVRRARVLRRALRHRRDQLELLRRAGTCDDEGLGHPHAGWLRVLAEALPEIHAPRDVPQGVGAGSVEPRRHRRRRVPPRHRSAGDGGQAGRAPRTVPRQLHQRARCARISGMAARAIQGVPRRRRATAPQLERRSRLDIRPAR